MCVCISNGFCVNCQIIVGNYTCFCAGGKCPKCKSHVEGLGGEFPKGLHGLIQKYNTNGELICYYKYENGHCLGTVPTVAKASEAPIPEETPLYKLIKENYGYYFNKSLVKHRFGFVGGEPDKWFYDFGHMNKDVSFKDFCDTIFANGVRKGKLDKEREIKQALGIK